MQFVSNLIKARIHKYESVHVAKNMSGIAVVLTVFVGNFLFMQMIIEGHFNLVYRKNRL
jgi:hypothetical protein